MNMHLKLGLSLALAFAPAALIGCGDTVDEITNNIDCHQICKRYAECFKSDYDVDGCTDRCENSADDDAQRERKLEMCDSCIDDRSCNEAAFNCTDDCLGIVP